MIKRMPSSKFWRQTLISICLAGLTYLIGGAYAIAVVTSVVYWVTALVVLVTAILYIFNQKTLPVEEQVPYTNMYLETLRVNEALPERKLLPLNLCLIAVYVANMISQGFFVSVFVTLALQVFIWAGIIAVELDE